MNTSKTADESGSSTVPNSKPAPTRNPVPPPRNPGLPRNPGPARKRADEEGSPESSAVLPPANPDSKPAARKECQPPCAFYRYLKIERGRKAKVETELKQTKSALHATRHTLQTTQKSLEKAKAQINQLKKAAQESRRSDELRAKTEMAQMKDASKVQRRREKTEEKDAKRQHELNMESLKSKDQRVAETQMKHERMNKAAGVARTIAAEAIKAQRESPRQSSHALPKSKSLPARHYNYE
jgi:hypothetical protein